MKGSGDRLTMACSLGKALSGSALYVLSLSSLTCGF